MCMEDMQRIHEINVVWVTRSFLDYRIPVYEELSKRCSEFHVIYNGEVVPQKVQQKAKELLGDRLIPMAGELKIKSKNQSYSNIANKGFRIPFQPNLIRTIRNLKPDVVISDGFFQWTYAALWIRLFNMRGIKHVMCYEKTLHTERNAGRLRTLYRKFVSRWIDAIDCNGILTEQYVRSLGYKRKTTFGHMVADVEGMSKKTAAVSELDVNALRDKLQLSDVNFIYVGRLIPLKGIMELLRAWKTADLSNASLLLVGEGEQRPEIEKFICENSLSSVKLLGRVDYDLLTPYYKSADCFIIPTLEDNWSLVVPEAMACGLPIACSIYNGCFPELVTESNGWTFDPLKEDAVIEVLREVVETKERLKEMGKASQRIVAKYTPKHAADGIYEACMYALNKLNK